MSYAIVVSAHEPGVDQCLFGGHGADAVHRVVRLDRDLERLEVRQALGRSRPAVVHRRCRAQHPQRRRTGRGIPSRRRGRSGRRRGRRAPTRNAASRGRGRTRRSADRRSAWCRPRSPVCSVPRSARRPARCSARMAVIPGLTITSAGELEPHPASTPKPSVVSDAMSCLHLHLLMNLSRSTTTRVTLPAATSPRSSDAETVNVRRRPSILFEHGLGDDLGPDRSREQVVDADPHPDAGGAVVEAVVERPAGGLLDEGDHAGASRARRPSRTRAPARCRRRSP